MALKEQRKNYNLLGNSLNYLKIFCHNLPTTNARNPIKGSKDADFSLVSLKNKQRIIPRGWEPWSGNLGQTFLAGSGVKGLNFQIILQC